MRNRVLLAAGTLAIVPTLLLAQQRPAQQPAQRPAQRPAAQPAQRPAAQPAPAARPMAGPHREGSWELSGGVGVFGVEGNLRGLLVGPGIFTADPGAVMLGGAARVGYNLNRNWGLSVGLGGGTGNGGNVISPFGGITYTLDLNRKMSPFATVGVGTTRFFKGSAKRTADYAAHAGVGVRSMMGENLALRVEGRLNYEKYGTDLGSPTAYTGMATVGLSYFVGGGPPKDTDGDGVPDKLDRCPNTPRGAVVDARGCPVDSDRDGVADNLDRCPNTPSGVRVDANGCPVDADGDGVADFQDRCPDTPRGAPVDANGCPKDSDGDGVADYLDRCADTPPNARPVDANGCPVDTDHDGVFDYLDRCANTAPGTQVDANGCPVEKDTDADGVVDTRDKCANTPRGVRVDADGCPYFELPAMNATLALRTVTFRGRTAVMLPASNADLDRIAIAINATPNSRWEIGGYTNNVGAAAALTRLSQQRADAVKAYLVSKGVAASSITAVGYGSQRPVANNRTPAGRAQNMRVEIKRLQ